MKCPGQDPRYWKEDAIFDVECPNCGHATEFFKDESRRRCGHCGERILNPKMDFGCAAHCKFARQCFGEDLPPELIKERENLFKDRVAVEMKLHFKRDFKRIGHAAKVARYAERLVPEEKGDPAVVLSAAYLHGIGMPEAEEKYGDFAEAHRHEEGPRIAREILEKLDADTSLIDEVCHIIGRQGAESANDSANAGIVHDADLLVSFEDAQKKGTLDEEKLHDRINREFLTESGKDLARSVLVDYENR